MFQTTVSGPQATLPIIHFDVVAYAFKFLSDNLSLNNYMHLSYSQKYIIFETVIVQRGILNGRTLTFSVKIYYRIGTIYPTYVFYRKCNKHILTSKYNKN